jgi:hypothetical protein
MTPLRGVGEMKRFLFRGLRFADPRLRIYLSYGQEERCSLRRAGDFKDFEDFKEY